jgi:hypothetical protein
VIKALSGAAGTIDAIEAVPFGGPGGGWSSPTRRFDWGPQPVATFDSKTLKIPPEKKLFQASYKKAVEDARARFDADVDRARQERLAKVNQALRELERLVLESYTGPVPCVPYRDLAERMRSRNLPFNLVLTTGARGCDDVLQQPVAVPGEVIVLLLPGYASGAVSEHTRFAQLETRVAKVFPAAHIVRPYSLSLIAQLLGGDTTQQAIAAPELPLLRAPVHKISFVPSQESVPEVASPAPRKAPNGLPESLRKILERVQRENVRVSWGPEQGQCYTCKDLQDDLAANKPATVANALKQNRDFIAVALALKAMTEEERTVLTNGSRVALNKTWTELGKVGPEGQTDCGKQMQLAIVNTCIDTLLDLVGKSVAELETLASKH